MKKTSCRAGIHLYLLSCGIVGFAIFVSFVLFFRMMSIQTPDGNTERSDWAEVFAVDFKDEIYFTDGIPKIKQNGIEQLIEKEIGLQIIDNAGSEVYSFQKPSDIKTNYTYSDFLQIDQNGYDSDNERVTIAHKVDNQDMHYIYIVFVPSNIDRVTMYFNGAYFKNGKTVFVYLFATLSLLIIIAGSLYGVWTARIIRSFVVAIQDISKRTFLQTQKKGMFHEIYDSFNRLDQDIRDSDKQKKETEEMRKAWITNITHDLKTPLSPIKGYAEIMEENNQLDEEQVSKYAGIIHKNALYIESLIADLKLTYQLDSGTYPLNKQNFNLVDFLREVIIDVLNRPEYEERTINFETDTEMINVVLDKKLLTRVFDNLIINAFIHGEELTEVTVKVSTIDGICITVEDDGPGIPENDLKKLFDRYYRGTNTENRTEGTGLGLAITKNIIEAHHGIICVTSTVGKGTKFEILL